ncbi:MAG: hypothetical protein EOP84_25390 [Verrucomicrobiaceae bacterium]|nr:MAG: hypothetical protein EOP84_25390 [Verrucomicrobiaceae bacterium]
MADIFFEQVPYDHLPSVVMNCPEFDGYLITGTDKMPAGNCGTGTVLCDRKSVRAISYIPFIAGQPLAEEIRQWSGSFLFRTDLIPDLLEHSREYHGMPYEAWLQGLLDRGARCAWIEGGPFINVNSAREYELLTSPSTNAHEQ